MKENYKKYKELMKNSRYKALNQLVLWFLFFGIIYLLVLLGFGMRAPISSNNNSIKEKTTLENYAEMDSFEFEYIFKYKDEFDHELRIVGTFINNKYYFTINENEYYYNDKLYLVLTDTKELKENQDIGIANYLFEIDNKTISNWINKSEIESETKYKDGTKTTVYLYNENCNILIKVSENEKKIKYMTLNLLDFVSTKDLHFESFELNIEYKNINNIDSISKNYDEYNKKLEGV